MFYLFISIDFDSPGVLVKNKHISQLHSISRLKISVFHLAHKGLDSMKYMDFFFFKYCLKIVHVICTEFTRYTMTVSPGYPYECSVKTLL